MLKVLMLIPFLGRGENLAGTPSHVLKLTRGLRKKGCEVRVFESRGDGMKVKNIDYSSSSFSVLWKLPFVLRDFRPDVVHSHTHVAGLVAIPFCAIFKIRHIYECHGVPRTSVDKPFRSKILNALESFVVRNANGVVTQALAMKKRLEKMMSSSDAKFLVSYPGLNTEEFSCYDGEPEYLSNKLKNKKNIIYIGTSLPYQGLSILADSQNYINRNDIHYVLYLSDGSAENVIQNFGFKMNITSIVNLEDSSKLPALLQAADVLVHSRPDTIDNVNVQSKLGLYLASGRPIVATNVGDYVDIFKESKSAYLTEPTGEDFANGLINVLDNRNTLEYAKKNGPILAAKYFEVDHNVDRLIHFYKDDYVS
jgi:glycosyltransferase involved in cell wall biosynthesis